MPSYMLDDAAPPQFIDEAPTTGNKVKEAAG
jgi:charged multivesicular body protein 5